MFVRHLCRLLLLELLLEYLLHLEILLKGVWILLTLVDLHTTNWTAACTVQPVVDAVFMEDVFAVTRHFANGLVELVAFEANDTGVISPFDFINLLGGFELVRGDLIDFELGKAFEGLVFVLNVPRGESATEFQERDDESDNK